MEHELLQTIRMVPNWNFDLASMKSYRKKLKRFQTGFKGLFGKEGIVCSKAKWRTKKSSNTNIPSIIQHITIIRVGVL